jgi:hypothetical protein
VFWTGLAWFRIDTGVCSRERGSEFSGGNPADKLLALLNGKLILQEYQLIDVMEE